MSIIATLITRCRLGAMLGWLLAGAVHAAAPGAAGNAAALSAGPPVLSAFSINNGAASTADPTLSLTWSTTGPAATHWRVSPMSTFPNTPWNPVPAKPTFKYLLDPTDGVKTLHLQVMNNQGQSAVRSAQLEFLAPPKITAIQAAPKGDVAIPALTQLTIQYTGKAHRFQVTQTPSPSQWWGTAPASGPIVHAYPVSGVPVGGQATVYAHLQRDGVSGTQTLAHSFTLTVNRSDYPYPGDYLLEFFRNNTLDAASHGVRVQVLLGPSDGCRHITSNNGVHYFSASTAAGKPVRCRFNLFNRQKMSFAWSPKAATVAFGDGSPVMEAKYMAPGSDCRVVEVAASSDSPLVAIEVANPANLQPTTSTHRETRCKLQNLTLFGPSGLPVLSYDTLKTAL